METPVAVINGITMDAPPGAIAFKYTDWIEEERWIFDPDDLNAVIAQDSSSVTLVTELEVRPVEAHAGPIVVCIRHPDASNDFTVFGGDVEIHDVDYGSGNLSDPEEYREFVEGWETTIAELRERGQHGAADCLAEAVRDGKGVR